MDANHSPFLHHFDLVLDRAHLVKFSVWGRVKAPTLFFSAWATLVYFLHSANLMPGTSNASSLVGILSMVYVPRRGLITFATSAHTLTCFASRAAPA